MVGMVEGVVEAPTPALPAGVGFRTIGELAVRCGHFCWLENQLFTLTGQWASAPATGEGTGSAADTATDPATDPAIRVLWSQMSSWHGFLAGQWHDRLPVRAGVDTHALIVPPSGGVVEALELLGGVPELAVRLGGLVEPILSGLLAAYDDEAAHASLVSELPVLGVLELARCHGRQEIEAARAAAAEGAAAGPGAGAGAGPRAGPGTVTVAELRGRLQRLLGADRGIFPAARAS
jgi:hypothetical protein